MSGDLHTLIGRIFHVNNVSLFKERNNKTVICYKNRQSLMHTYSTQTGLSGMTIFRVFKTLKHAFNVTFKSSLNSKKKDLSCEQLV